MATVQCDCSELEREKKSREECERKLKEKAEDLYYVQRRLKQQQEMCEDLIKAQLEQLENRKTEMLSGLYRIRQNCEESAMLH